MERILIIDDDRFILETFSDIINEYLPDIEVMTAATGVAGLDLVMTKTPSLILLDLILPDKSGLELCKEIKSNPATQYIPIIIITGMNTQSKLKIKTLEAGADTFLNKPVHIAELIAQIKSMLRLKASEEKLRMERDQLKTQYEETSTELDALEERWKIIMQSTNEGIWDLNLRTGEMFFSTHWKDALVYDDEDVINTQEDFYSLIHEDDLLKFKDELDKYLKRQVVSFYIEIRIKSKIEEYMWFAYRAQAVWNSEGEAVRIVGTQVNIHERKELETELLHIAHHDAITGIPNRVLFQDRLHQAIAQTNRFKTKTAVMFIDLDGFKAVNDTYGHNVGDILLKHVAERLKSAVRKVDTVARLGGDEFAIILPDVKKRINTQHIANRIINDVSKNYDIQKQDIHVSASLGISIYPDDTDNIINLINNADLAMYRAKQAGKNRFLFYSENIPSSEEE